MAGGGSLLLNHLIFFGAFSGATFGLEPVEEEDAFVDSVALVRVARFPCAAPPCFGLIFAMRFLSRVLNDTFKSRCTSSNDFLLNAGHSLSSVTFGLDMIAFTMQVWLTLTAARSSYSVVSA